ncbi:MAG: flagellar basal body-associated FliL family protein [candidate division Zixibacteria bacterium]|nr:flagellar basal body-associated FliL family protein [candidate division Zixibacteria bacterium]
MPDVKEKTEVAPPPAPPRKSLKSLIPGNLTAILTKAAIFGVIGLAAIVAAFMITTKVLKPMLAHSSAPTEQKVEPPPAPVEKKAEAKAEEHKKDEGGKEGEGGTAEINYFNIESIVVNPAGTGGTRYLSCGISFEMAGAEDVKIFESKAAQVKDILITILSSKTVDELADIRQRNQMRRQILTIVNRFLAPTQAKAVYLTDFVLQ